MASKRAKAGRSCGAEEAPSEALSDAERRALRAGCDRTLHGHGLRTAADTLAELATLTPDELAVDIYGEGGTVAVLEDEVRALLGKPAAVFMPSGTMVQQSALRIHADHRDRRVVAFHPTCHLELHEDKAHQRLHGLIGRPVGDGRSLLTLADLDAVREPLAALVIELPQREIGGRLPTWQALVAQVAWARERGAAVHLDGARLWECGPFYGRPLSEIAGLFDTVYVSFYKGLGGTAGAMRSARRTSSPRLASGAIVTAARSSTCGRTPWRPLPGCDSDCHGWAPTWSMPGRSRRRCRGSMALRWCPTHRRRR
jgi:hypothetical protein